MTDLKKFIALYKGFGIKCIVNTRIKSNIKTQHIYLNSVFFDDGRKPTISKKFDGYLDFYSEAIFDEKGKFISQGFWE